MELAFVIESPELRSTFVRLSKYWSNARWSLMFKTDACSGEDSFAWPLFKLNDRMIGSDVRL